MCPFVSRQVEASDIKFFSMAKCPDTPPLTDDRASEMEDIKESQEENYTHVYFYVTSDNEADPILTEKFPLFPTDLDISEELTYLLPRVCEVPHTSRPTHCPRINAHSLSFGQVFVIPDIPWLFLSPEGRV